MAKTAEKIEFFTPQGERIGSQSSEVPPIEDDIQQHFEEMRAEFGDAENDVTWTAKVTRVTGPNKKGDKEPYLFTVDSAEINTVYDRLRDQYGSGLYRVRVRKNGVLWKQFDIPVEAATTPPKENSESLAGLIATEMRSLREQQNELLQRLLTDKPQQQQIDPFVMMERMSTIMKNLSPAGGAPQTDSVGMLTGVLTLAEKIVDMRGDIPAAAGAGWQDALLELAKNPDVVKTVMENVVPQRPQQRGPNGFAQPQRRQLTNPVGRPFNGNPGGNVGGRVPGIPERSGGNMVPPQTETSAGQRNGETDSQEPTLDDAIRYLNGRAARGSEVTFYADWLIDNAPEAAVQWLVATPNALDVLIETHPGMRPYRPWYERLLAELREPVEYEDGQPQGLERVDHSGNDAQPPGRAGNLLHPQRDGAPRAGGEAEHPGAGSGGGADA